MKSEKQFLLDEILANIDDATSFVIAGYTKLEANKANEFRREISKIGANFEVVKKRIFVKAVEAHGMKVELKSMPGHVGILFSKDDPIEMTKAILKFNKDNENVFSFLGCKLENQLLGKGDTEKLSKLPAKDVMRAQLLGLFEAPMAQTLAVMEALLTSVVYCIDNKIKEQ